MIQKCIICKSKKIYHYDLIVKNRYTEEFSKHLKLSIEDLEKNYSNLVCKNCNFIFKKKWFSKKFLNKVYSNIVPLHPRGWDTISKKFKKKYLFNQFNILEKKIKNNENEYAQDHIKRTIFGITSSMKLNIKESNLINQLHVSIRENNLKKINILKDKINFNFEAKKFSRYSGFQNIELFNYIKKKLGNIQTYGEIGCPLWGMISIAKQDNCSTYFIKPEDGVFWGSNCKKGKYRCIDKISKTKIVSNFNKLNINKLDFLGVFNFIDHYQNPINFLKKALKYSKSVGVITEKSTSGIPIQHHHLLSNKSVKKIGLILKKKVDFEYNKIIKKSDYNFYLFY